MKQEKSVVISGSFRKFKPEIDSAIEEFEELGVRVLAPDKGWLARQSLAVVRLEPQPPRPLPSERGLSPKQIEDRFLAALKRANFHYLMNVDGYLGDMSAFELGHSLAWQKPMYAKEAYDFNQMEMYDLAQRRFLLERTVVASPSEAVAYELIRDGNIGPTA